MTTQFASYPASAQSVTITLNSLATSTTAGRSTAAWDNTSNKYLDIGMTIRVKTNASAPTGVKGCYVYVYASIDGTNFSGSSAEAVGTDVAVTFDVPTNLIGQFFISCPAASTTYELDISFAQIFGYVPQKGGVVINNQTGNALNSSGNTVTWSGYQETSS